MNNDELDNFTVDDSKKWGALSLMIGLAMYFIASRYLIDNKATVFSLFVGLMIFLVRYYWRLRAAVWFWILVATIFAVDMIAVFLVPAGKWPNALIILAPIAAVQLTISIFLISTVDSAIRKRSASH